MIAAQFFHLCIIEKRRPANVTKGGEIGGEIEGRNWNKMLKKLWKKMLEKIFGGTKFWGENIVWWKKFRGKKFFGKKIFWENV